MLQNAFYTASQPKNGGPARCPTEIPCSMLSDCPDFRSLKSLKKRMEEIGEKLSSAKQRERSIRASSIDRPSHSGDGRSTENLAVRIADLEEKYFDAWADYNLLYIDCYQWIEEHIDKPIGGPRERLILIGRYVKGLSWKETADFVGDSEDATKKYAQRYLVKLRETFTDFPL